MTKFIACFTLALACSSTFAQLPTDQNAKLTVGGLLSFGSKAYVLDDEVSAVPLFLYDNNRLYAEGAEFGLYPYKDDRHWLKAGLTYDGTHFDPKKTSPALRGLHERKTSVNAHISYMHITPVGGFEVKAMSDVSNRSDGQRLALAHRSKFDFFDDKLTVYPKVGAMWHSSRYNNYYYGVSSEESSLTGVESYTPKSSISPFVSISAKYQLNDKFGVFGNQSVQWLSTTQKHSPLTDDDLDIGTNVGLTYTF